MNKLLISPSPHVHSGDSIEKNMYGVLIALIPAFICSVLFFGMGAIIVTLTSVVACLFFEYVIQKFLLKQQPTIFDGSALITGVLLAFNVPSNLPVWIIVIGALVAIGIGKMSFGGLGCNIFNPALVGRVFLLISFPVQMTTWPLAQGFAGSYIDAQTGATPLAMLKEAVTSGQSVTDLLSAESFIGYKNMLIGNMGGSLGEVAALALLIGFAYMLFRENHYLAYSGKHFRHCNCIFGYSESLQSLFICRSCFPFVIRRFDVRCNLYGYRLRYFTDEQQRNDHLWNRNRPPHSCDPRVRCLSGRNVVRYPDHECFHSADQQIL